LNPRHGPKNIEMKYKTHILNLCMNYMVHVSSTMWRIKNLPSKSTSYIDNALRLLVLVANELYWGLRVTRLGRHTERRMPCHRGVVLWKGYKNMSKYEVKKRYIYTHTQRVGAIWMVWNNKLELQINTNVLENSWNRSPKKSRVLTTQVHNCRHIKISYYLLKSSNCINTKA
jgi:hypothetical protein